MTEKENPNKPVLLIDSDCKFCSKSMQFIINHGGENKYEFYSLYSDEGKKILKQYGFNENYNESIVLVEGENAYTKSDAALRVSKNLNGILPLIYRFKFIPRGLRDAVYDFIAKHRHKLYKH